MRGGRRSAAKLLSQGRGAKDRREHRQAAEASAQVNVTDGAKLSKPRPAR
jgi:hypothetical protein